MVRPSFELGRRTVASSRARPDGRGIRPHHGPARALAERARTGRFLPPLVGALRVLALGTPPAPVPYRGRRRTAGAGRERRSGGPRGGRSGRLQGREPQPSLGRGAVSG